MSFPIKISAIAKGVALATTGVLLSTTAAQAASFSSIRIGDVDGFGYGDGSGYTAANGGSVNVDGQGMLGNGDFLADLNGDSRLATGSNDNFDYRSIEEKGNQFITGLGFTDNGSSGSQYTDVSLSVSSLNDFYGITTLEKSQQDLSAQRKQKTNKVNGLNKDVKKADKNISSWQKKTKNLENKIKTSEKNIKDREKKIKQFKKEGFTEESGKIRGQASKIKSENAKIDGWKNEINGFTKKIKAAEDSKVKLNKEIDQLSGKSENLLKEIKDIDAKIDKIHEEFYSQDSRIPQAEFLFDFSVARNSVVEDSPFYLNMLFADYDVKDAAIEFTTANGSFTRELTKQENSAGQDGLIQSAFVELTFDEVFSAAGDNFDGYVQAKVIAPDEPYLAFDYVEISASQIAIVGQDPTDIPEPATALGLLAVGAIGAGSLKKRQHT